jgi:hypothetical protein
MVICTLSEPFVDGAWKEIVALEPLATLPNEDLAPDAPAWEERVIEVSLLRRPGILATAIGIPPPHDILALKQVWRIDLYLRVNGGLHLFEVKKPTAHREYRKAARQLARQYVDRSVWIRRGAEAVHLWAVCPVKWSRRRQSPKIPAEWRVELAAIKNDVLPGEAAPTLGLLFYSVVKASKGRLFLLWRADEEVPISSGQTSGVGPA